MTEAMEERVRLGKMLVDAGLLTGEQLKKAIDAHKKVGGRLGSTIVKLGYIQEKTLTEFIGRQQGLAIVEIDELVIPENLVKKIPRNIIEKHEIIPIGIKGETLTIAIADPFDFDALEELQLVVDYKIEMNLAPRSSIVKAIRDIFGEKKEAIEAEKTKEELLREIAEERSSHSLRNPSAGLDVTPLQMRKALVPLLIEKGIITEEELKRKARETQ